MRAMVIKEFNQPWTLEEVAAPEPGHVSGRDARRVQPSATAAPRTVVFP